MEAPAWEELPVPERGAGETPHLAGQQGVHQWPQQECPHLWLHSGHEPLRRYCKAIVIIAVFGDCSLCRDFVTCVSV